MNLCDYTTTFVTCKNTWGRSNLLGRLAATIVKVNSESTLMLERSSSGTPCGEVDGERGWKEGLRGREAAGTESVSLHREYCRSDRHTCRRSSPGCVRAVQGRALGLRLCRHTPGQGAARCPVVPRPPVSTRRTAPELTALPLPILEAALLALLSSSSKLACFSLHRNPNRYIQKYICRTILILTKSESQRSH